MVSISSNIIGVYNKTSSIVTEIVSSCTGCLFSDTLSCYSSDLLPLVLKNVDLQYWKKVLDHATHYFSRIQGIVTWTVISLNIALFNFRWKTIEDLLHNANVIFFTFIFSF